ncbi:cupin domain-containing protein [Streptomyces alanosinicus]|nr:cupin domain-containing protein [Streptomyces alanosinicus]
MAGGPLNFPLPWHDTEIAAMEFQQITLPPQASTGWHYHHGPLLVTVHQGTLRRRLADGTVTAHAAGTSFVEPPGPANIHTGDNPDSTTVIL